MNVHNTATKPEKSDSLFRSEVLAGKQEWLGEILLVRPISFSFLTAFALTIALAIALFLVFGEYTRKEKVTGQVVLSQSLAKIYSPVIGTVLKRMVNEGDAVTKGQSLYVVSTERTSTSKGEAQVAIAQQLAIRRANLQEVLIKQRAIFKEEEAALRRRIHDSCNELIQLEQEISTQKEMFSLNSQNIGRYLELGRRGFLSQADLRDREQANLNLRAQFEGSQRTRISIQKELASLQTDLRNMPLKFANQVAATERSLAELEQQAVENEARREIAIPAQVDGVATAVLAEVGQIVGGNTPLVGLVPQSAKFEARLYVPSRAIGFIKAGNIVQIRYQAFPYQKFGQYSGKIKDIAHTALAPSELQMLGATQEPFYRVTVALDMQNVVAYGQPMRLQDGMQLEADVEIDKRKLYEWALEPLYSLSGKY